MTYHKNSEKGFAAEKLFKEIGEALGFIIHKASVEEDRYQHWDFEVQYPSEEHSPFKVDVKNNVRFQKAVVEFRNVRGEEGWIYGEADYLAILMEEGFYFVSREKLLHHCIEYCDLEDIQEHSHQALYKGYTREKQDPSKKDLITFIPSDAIKVLHSFIWQC